MNPDMIPYLGLWVMAFASLLYALDTRSKVNKLEERVKKLETQIRP